MSERRKSLMWRANEIAPDCDSQALQANNITREAGGYPPVTANRFKSPIALVISISRGQASVQL